ncbi:hypothetical protein BWD42_04110 [Sphingobacterium sp. CZ-UAM]|uniref:hypothetical protein n=1 Tax=Sphingobacterium sp. CZ-UAM TaxID=1933868 RepID=UPI000985C4BB|nr:hypothetical protein [Sphingobacterium sp. CZ-UAM]OOG19142.1 hypothetical protein BWD42_04110 [Sphingobacterium sp. CZ-UAM]
MAKTQEKTPKYEIERRIRNVQEWIMDDYPYGDIVRSIVNKWGLSERQAQRYIKTAYDEFKDKEELSIEAKKAYYIKRKKKLIRDMDPRVKTTASGARAINKILDSMAELEGIKINKVQLTGKDGEPLIPEVGVLPAVVILPNNGRDIDDRDTKG